MDGRRERRGLQTGSKEGPRSTRCCASALVSAERVSAQTERCRVITSSRGDDMCEVGGSLPFDDLRRAEKRRVERRGRPRL